MDDELIPVMTPSGPELLTPPRLTSAQFYTLWLRSQDSEQTRRAYDASIRRFADYLRAPHAIAAVELLLSLDRGSANALAEGWRAELRKTFAPNTVNLRLTALRDVVKDAKRYGLIEWLLDVENVESKAYRDTRGPGRESYRKMREACAARGDTPKGRRDAAILRLLHDTALRSKEVRGLKLDDVDRDGDRIWITGKGRSQREAITLPPSTLAALVGWLDTRGPQPGYVFCRLDRARRGVFDKPIAHKSVWKLVGDYGRKAGVKAAPHGLRHTGISTAAERCRGDMVQVAAFARHANINTTKIYIDNAKDQAGIVARLVAED